MTEALEILDNYTNMVEERKETQAAYTKFKMTNRSDSIEGITENDEVFSSERSSTIYTKSSAETIKITFDDFQIISIIGKGTFGKVSLDRIG
jgi:hypothetical protein